MWLCGVALEAGKLYISNAYEVYSRREERMGEGTRALLSIRQDRNENEQTCASQMAAQQPAGIRDAACLLCHVRTRMGSGYVHKGISYPWWGRLAGID